MENKKEYTKFEIARILGARALQLSMDAPLLVKIDDEELEKLGYDPLKIAEKEFNEGILPITVKRVLPEMTKKKLKAGRREERNDDVKKEEVEKTEEKEIREEGEIMELVQPEDEVEQEESGGEAEE
ncbi:DNA-directed RNA polymerase subunit K [Candidatus Woesearchaeota archaeon CG10_big_fil_rev_8_21_14_0_10_34_12]|nr:MAG: DNA-directed RNA polymerase subunit K [Candidatus Woesearchaeota archaeon CG10_big_fil_rev_8_21_14_0_10_34_12]